MTTRLPILAIAAAVLIATSAAAQITLEDFEVYSIASGTGKNLQISLLDELATANGQGPGLVQDGCAYAAPLGQLTWFGANYNNNTTSKAIAANVYDSKLELHYDVPVQHVVLDLVNYRGSVDNVEVAVYDAQLVEIRRDYYLVTAPYPVRINYTAPSVSEVWVRSLSFLGGSPCVDDHEFSVTGGLMISLLGSCSGPMTANFSGFTPNKNFALLYASQRASFPIPTGSICSGEVLGLMNPILLGIFKANGAGSLSVTRSVPASFCGKYLQAVDLSNCMQSNVIQIP